MTTKVLTGTYSAGYLLGAPITTLSIAASGFVGGSGIATAANTPASYTVINDGGIREADAGQANGLYLGHGGVLTNGGPTDMTARIQGWRGVRMEHGSGVVGNFGTIIGDVRSGVLLNDGGIVTNGSAQNTGALIKGMTAGVGIAGAAGTVVNFGLIAGEVLLRNGGTVTNGSPSDTSALMLAVAPFNAVYLGPSGTVTNYARIENRQATGSSVGVLLNGAGLTNGSPGDGLALIYGYTGVQALVAAPIINWGTVEGTGAAGAGVLLTAGGVLTNGAASNSSARITGAVGAYAQGAGATVINYGTIMGSADSVKFGSAGDVLIADGGARFVGAIVGGGGTLVVRGPGSGTIGGLGGAGVLAGAVSGTFSGFGSYVIGTIGTWSLNSANTLTAGHSLTDNGAFIVGGSLAEAAGAAITVNARAAITFTGSGSVLAGTVSGLGSVAFVGGFDTFNGTNLSAAHMAIKGAVMLLGTIANAGTVSVATSALLIGTGGAALSGGTWALSDSAANKVTGLAAGDTLDVHATISGAGALGAGVMGLIVRSGGAIDGNGTNVLIVDTGANRIANAGLIEAVGAGGLTIQSAINNGGKLEAGGGTLTVNGAVIGVGTGVIVGGALIFNSTFSQNVTFSGTTGVLQLAQSQTYAGTIAGFSTIGGTFLDLRDIAYVNANEATYSGTASGGMLTVSDGTHTAHIKLTGDYLASTFVAASDGHGGVIVHDPGPAQRFIEAASALGAGGGAAVSVTNDTWRTPPPMLARPAVATA